MEVDPKWSATSGKGVSLNDIAGYIPQTIIRWVRWFNRTKDNPFLAGEYAPVLNELEAADLPVEGAVPPELHGLYIRTGPNPQHRPDGGYHWFDGDAMVHAVHFAGGKARSYANHWLRTPRFVLEKQAGRNIWPRFGDNVGVLGLLILKLFDRFEWAFPGGLDRYTHRALGNTALVFHAKRLLALVESGYPFLLRFCKGVVASVGVHLFGGALTHNYTAHPKKDPVTGELLGFAYRPMLSEADARAGKHLVTYSCVSRDGVLGPDHPVDVSRGQMMHDFAITERYAVFMDHALVFDGPAMVKKGGMPFSCDKSVPSRLGLLRRADPAAGVRWFEVDPFVCFHTANAWEDGDTVHLVLCRYDDIDLRGGVSGRFASTYPEVHRFSVDLSTGSVARTCLVPGRYLDFPVIPPQLTGRRARFVYCAEAGSTKAGVAADTRMSSWCKVDMLAGEGAGLVGEIKLPAGHVMGEAVFVPRNVAGLAAGKCDEDDGWLVAYVTDTASMTSTCNVYDARTMAAEPVAQVVLPQRVPMGFHGLFVPQADLDSQAAT